MHQKIATLTLTLDRLPTIEGIRTEIARLESQNYPALSFSISTTENKCQAIALAQQIRGWFETLGYRFEKYEVWEDNHYMELKQMSTTTTKISVDRYSTVLIYKLCTQQ